MGIFDSLFGSSQNTNTRSTGTTNSSTQNNLYDDPAYRSFLAGFNQQYQGAGNFNVPINPYQTGAATNQQGVATNPSLATGFNTAGNIAQNGFAPQMSAFQNPFENQVVGNLQSDFARQNEEQMSAIRGGAAKSGALGNNTGQNALLMRGAQDAQAKAIANTRMTGFNTAADLANRNATTQLAGAGQIGNLTGAATGANTAQFGMGQNLWEDAYKNARTPFDLYNQGQSGYLQAGNLAGSTTNSNTTGTQNSTTQSNPSLFQGLAGIAGLGTSLFGGGGFFPGLFGGGGGGGSYTGGGTSSWARDGGVIKGYNSGGAVGSVLPSFHGSSGESFADKVARAHETVSKLRASGGRTENSTAKKGAIEPMGVGRWETEVTPYHSDRLPQEPLQRMNAFMPYAGMDTPLAWSPMRPMQYDLPELRGFDDGGSVLPETFTPFQGFDASNSAAGQPGYVGSPFSQFPSPSQLLPVPLNPFEGALNSNLADDGVAPADIRTTGNVMEAYNPNGPPRTASMVPASEPVNGPVMDPNATASPGGSGRRQIEQMHPHQRLAAMLLSASGPNVLGPGGRALIDMHQQRIAEHGAELQADQLAQQLAHQNATLGLSREQLAETVAHRNTQSAHQTRELAERERHNQATEELGNWQARPDGSMINRKTGEIRESGLPTEVERRRTEAESVGLRPGMPGYNEFLLTGKLNNRPVLTPSQEARIVTAENETVSGTNALNNINEAIKLNPQSYSGNVLGLGPETRSTITNIGTLGVGTQGSENTADLRRLMMSGVLANLKNTFGGNPSDGERRILSEVEGSVDGTVEQRRRVLERARVAVEARLALNERRVREMRDGTYFRPEQQRTGDAQMDDPTSQLPPEGANPNAIPPMPPSIPAGSLYNPARKQWKAPDGKIYDAQGRPV